MGKGRVRGNFEADKKSIILYTHLGAFIYTICLSIYIIYCVLLWRWVGERGGSRVYLYVWI